MEYNIYDGHSNNSCRLAAVTNDTKGCIATSGIRIPVSSNNWKFQMDKTILVACQSLVDLQHRKRNSQRHFPN